MFRRFIPGEYSVRLIMALDSTSAMINLKFYKTKNVSSRSFKY